MYGNSTAIGTAASVAIDSLDNVYIARSASPGWALADGGRRVHALGALLYMGA